MQHHKVKVCFGDIFSQKAICLFAFSSDIFYEFEKRGLALQTKEKTHRSGFLGHLKLRNNQHLSGIYFIWMA